MNSVSLETLLHQLFVSLSDLCEAQIVVVRGVGLLVDINPVRRLNVLELLLVEELDDVTIALSVNLTFGQRLELAHLFHCPQFDGLS